MVKRFLAASWRNLVAINYQIDPPDLTPLLPSGVELDIFEGSCFVSLVAFQFLDTKVLGVSIPRHRNFEEINLRFYVRRALNSEVRRGVTFIKELVPRRAIAAVARGLYNENYFAVPLSHTVSLERDSGSIAYSWQEAGREHAISAQVSGGLVEMDSGSEAEFIFEHYWGYTRQRDNSTMEYRVAHPRWRVWRSAEVELECDFAAVYGEQFGTVMNRFPHSVMVAEGSPIKVDLGTRFNSP